MFFVHFRPKLKEASLQCFPYVLEQHHVSVFVHPLDPFFVTFLACQFLWLFFVFRLLFLRNSCFYMHLFATSGAFLLHFKSRGHFNVNQALPYGLCDFPFGLSLRTLCSACHRKFIKKPFAATWKIFFSLFDVFD